MGYWKRLARRRARSCAVIGSVVVMLSACGSGGSEVSGSGGAGCADIPDGAVKVGSILPLSGPFAALGANNDKATSIAVEAFNANNDICGREIEVVRADDKGDPASGVASARKLVSEGVSIFIDTSRGETNETVLSYLMKEGAIAISDGTYDYRFDTEESPTFYGINPPDGEQMKQVAAHIQEQNWKNVGILTDGLNGGTRLSAHLVENLKGAGNPVVKTVTYSPTAIDVSSELQQLKNAGVETLFLGGTTNVTNIVASLKTSNWKPNLAGVGLLFEYGVKATDVPEGTTDSCYIHRPADHAPEGTDGFSPVTLDLLEDAAEEFGAHNPAINAAHGAYSRLLVAKAAVEKAGSLDAGRLKDAMDSLQDVEGAWPGVTYSFSKDDHAGFPTDRLPGWWSVCRLDTSRLGIRYEAA